MGTERLGATTESGAALPTTPTVAELKARLKDIGWKLPANVVEKSELLALVEEAEKQKASKPSPRTSSPSNPSSPPTSPKAASQTDPPAVSAGSGSSPGSPPARSVADMKRSLRELGLTVPSNIVEKSELRALVEEAERQAASSTKSQKGPVAPAKSAAAFKLGSRLRELGVEVPDNIVDEEELRALLKEAEKKQPTAEVKGRGTDSITMTCTRGAQGVARIEVHKNAAAEEGSTTDAATLSSESDKKFDPRTWQRGDNIGHGSFGSVFKALNPETGTAIAVKEVYIDLHRQSEEKLKVALENEINLMRSMRHQNIVAYYGCDWADDHLHMYLEFMPGGSLSQVLEQFGPLEESLIAQYTRQLLAGLEYLHTQNPYIVHRDIKGANVLVGVDSQVKLADFGCSKRAKETTSLTIEGSIPWMAPEVLTHSRYGRSGDIWSFGCLIIEMATADAPWGQFDNIMAAILKIGMSGELPPVPETLSLVCRDFIRRCTQHDPGKRFSASELLNEEFALASTGDGFQRPEKPPKIEKGIEDVEDDAPVQTKSADKAEEEEALPEGWEKHFDPSYSAWYYWHRNSGRSVWERPSASFFEENGDEGSPLADTRESQDTVRLLQQELLSA